MSNAGAVHLQIDGGIASVTFDRPEARNAMTWAMYEQLRGICEQLCEDPSVRVVRFQGAGGEAFVAGTDIAQFLEFTSGEDGIAYERRIDATMGLLAALPMPTVAVVQGWCIGGGLAIASTCDFRIATPTSRFGVPIARTLGNCLSMANVAGLVAAFGDAIAGSSLPVRLVCAGDPSDWTELRRADALRRAGGSSHRIHLLGNSDARSLLSAADAFVLDSFFEGWSLATTEAMTSGLPVVLSEVAGAREQLAVPAGSDPAGILVGNPGGALEVSWETVSASRFRRQPNHDELVAALTRMVVERDLWAARRDRMAQEASERFDPQRCLDRHAEVLREAASAARATG